MLSFSPASVKPANAEVVLFSHLYAYVDPLPPAAALPVKVAGALPVQIPCATLMVLLEMAVLTEIPIAIAADVSVAVPETTYRLYQVVTVSEGGE
jgi:hypothetical protein